MWAARYWAPRYWAGRFWSPRGLTPAPGFYWTPNYFANRYWTRSYWGNSGDTAQFTATVASGLAAAASVSFGSATLQATNDFTSTVTSGLTVAAGVGINATPQLTFANEFIAAAPLTLPLITASCTFSATVVLGFEASAGTGFYWPGRYFTPSYWAPRYWQTQAEFIATVTSGLSCSAACTYAATVEQVLSIAVLNTLTVDATALLAATVTASTPQPAVEFGGGWANVPMPKKRKRREEPKEEPVEAVVVKETPAKRIPAQFQQLLEKPKKRKAKPAQKADEKNDDKRSKDEEVLLLY